MSARTMNSALPLIVTHGWPGSVIEQLKIVDLLVNPTAHGASASDAFHLVIPSMPGYGFSGKPAATGWDPARIARAWVALMKRLGYPHFVSQGGDWGGAVTNVMAQQAPPELLGIHVNLPGTVPPGIARALQSGDPPPSGLSADERRAYKQLTTLYTRRRAYATMMGTRPQTLYGLADSPVGLAAWLLDHGDGWGQPAPPITSAVLGHTSHGHRAGDLTRDDVLDNITLYWVTSTAVSSARLYWENKLSLYNAADVSVPAAVSVFPGENYQAPRSWTEQAYHNLIYFNEADQGGHFAAWEQPELFSQGGSRRLQATAQVVDDASSWSVRAACMDGKCELPRHLFVLLTGNTRWVTRSPCTQTAGSPSRTSPDETAPKNGRPDPITTGTRSTATSSSRPSSRH